MTRVHAWCNTVVSNAVDSIDESISYAQRWNLLLVVTVTCPSLDSMR